MMLSPDVPEFVPQHAKIKSNVTSDINDSRYVDNLCDLNIGNSSVTTPNKYSNDTGVPNDNFSRGNMTEYNSHQFEKPRNFSTNDAEWSTGSNFMSNFPVPPKGRSNEVGINTALYFNSNKKFNSNPNKRRSHKNKNVSQGESTSNRQNGNTIYNLKKSLVSNQNCSEKGLIYLRDKDEKIWSNVANISTSPNNLQQEQLWPTLKPHMSEDVTFTSNKEPITSSNLTICDNVWQKSFLDVAKMPSKLPISTTHQQFNDTCILDVKEKEEPVKQKKGRYKDKHKYNVLKGKKNDTSIIWNPNNSSQLKSKIISSRDKINVNQSFEKDNFIREDTEVETLSRDILNLDIDKSSSWEIAYSRKGKLMQENCSLTDEKTSSLPHQDSISVSKEKSEKEIENDKKESKAILAKDRKEESRLRKLKLKEEKRRKREEHIKRNREDKRKDTRVHLVSQDFLTKISGSKNTKTTTLKKKFDLNVSDYPSLDSNTQTLKTKEKQFECDTMDTTYNIDSDKYLNNKPFDAVTDKPLNFGMITRDNLNKPKLNKNRPNCKLQTPTSASTSLSEVELRTKVISYSAALTMSAKKITKPPPQQKKNKGSNQQSVKKKQPQEILKTQGLKKLKAKDIKPRDPKVRELIQLDLSALIKRKLDQPSKEATKIQLNTQKMQAKTQSNTMYPHLKLHRGKEYENKKKVAKVTKLKKIWQKEHQQKLKDFLVILEVLQKRNETKNTLNQTSHDNAYLSTNSTVPFSVNNETNVTVNTEVLTEKIKDDLNNPVIELGLCSTEQNPDPTREPNLGDDKTAVIVDTSGSDIYDSTSQPTLSDKATVIVDTPDSAIYDQTEQTKDLPSDIDNLKTVDEIDEQTRETCIALTKEIKEIASLLHTRKFREYCNHIISPEINKILEVFISALVKYQRRMFDQNPQKASAKKRYYCGLKETRKHMNKITCIIIPPNIRPGSGPGNMDEKVVEVLDLASQRNVPVIFGLSLNKLAKLCELPKKTRVSCLGIVNFQGAQDSFSQLMELLSKARDQYEALAAMDQLRNSNVAEEQQLQMKETR